MVVHPEGWAFISTMKCATNTMYEVLPKIGGVRVGGFHMRPIERVGGLHFSICRNPYDRAVSIWASTCLRDGDRYLAKQKITEDGGDYREFRDFCRSCLLDKGWTPHEWLFRNQVDWYDSTIIDELVHLENLKEELEELVGPVPSLPKENESTHDAFSAYASPEVVEMVNEWACDDFNLGYDLWTPTQPTCTQQ